MVHPARPGNDNADFDDNADFLVRFEPADGPGFYPGAGGFFHGCTLPQEPRVVFYGTDFGTTCEAGAARAMGGEAENQRTIARLRALVEGVARDIGENADWCYLTNAVLGLAKLKPGIVKGNDCHRALSARSRGMTVRTWSTAWLGAGRFRGTDGFRPVRIGRIRPIRHGSAAAFRPGDGPETVVLSDLVALVASAELLPGSNCLSQTNRVTSACVDPAPPTCIGRSSTISWPSAPA